MYAFCHLNFANFLLSPACPWPFQIGPKSHLEPPQRSKDSPASQDSSMLFPFPASPSPSCLHGPSSHSPVRKSPAFFFQNLLPVLTSFSPGLLWLFTL